MSQWIFSMNFLLESVSRRTLIDWRNFMRGAVHLQNRPPIGGVGHIMEIDESLFGQRIRIM